MTAVRTPLRAWHRTTKARSNLSADLTLRLTVGNALAVSACRVTGVSAVASERWALDRASGAAFARHLVHTCLAASVFKHDQERIAASLRPSAAPEREVYVESGASGESRGFARGFWLPDEAASSGHMIVRQFLANARVPHTTTIRFDEGQQRQSACIVDEAWRAYYEQSDQATATASLVHAAMAEDGDGDGDGDGDEDEDANGAASTTPCAWAGGLMVQAVAESGGWSQGGGGGGGGAAQLELLQTAWRSADDVSSVFRAAVDAHPEDTKAGLLAGVRAAVGEPLGLEVALYDEAEETDNTALAATQQTFFCGCKSTDHAASIIRALGTADTQALLEEETATAEGGVGIDCHMCNAYHLVPSDLLHGRVAAWKRQEEAEKKEQQQNAELLSEPTDTPCPVDEKG